LEIFLAQRGCSISVSRAAGHPRATTTTHIDKPDIAKDFNKAKYSPRSWHSLPRKIEHFVTILYRLEVVISIIGGGRNSWRLHLARRCQ
jgi:hypothetical protein